MKQSLPIFVKWPGGKRQLIEQLSQYLPPAITRYFEPFVGGGAVAFHIIREYRPQEVYLSDANDELINAYHVTRDNAEELIRLLREYEGSHSKDTYYLVRAMNPEMMPSAQRAARFIYLNRTCYNGLYRVNSMDQFNVPMGSYKNPLICPERSLREASELLQGVDIQSKPFQWVLGSAREGDFVYLDPPYHPRSRTSSFTKYTREDFLEREQIQLAEVFRQLDDMNCNVMQSNSDTHFIRELYSRYEDTTYRVKARRMINSKPTGRGAVDELVITNYRPSSAHPKLLMSETNANSVRLRKRPFSCLDANPSGFHGFSAVFRARNSVKKST